MSDTLKYQKVKTRKTHKCFSCYRKFEPGTTMFYWFVVDGGDTNSGYYCLTCDAIIYKKNEDEIDEGYVYNALEKNQTPEDYLNTINHG